MSKRLPDIKDVTSGKYNIREMVTGQLYDSIAEKLSASTTLAESLIAITADAETGRGKISIPDAVPAGDYELAVYNVTEVTSATEPYRHVPFRVGYDGKAVLT